MSAIHAEIALDVRVIVCVNDPYSLDFAGRRRKAISGPELHRAITTGRRRGSRNTAAVCNDTCVTAASAEGGRAGANWAVTGSHERRGEQEGHEKSSQAHRDLQQDGFPARQRSSRKAAGL